MSKDFPHKYFENLPNRILSRIVDLEDNISENAPVLARINKENIYLVPDFYFAESRTKLMNQNTKTRVLRVSLRRIAIAASIALVLAFGIDLAQNVPDSKVNLAEADILNYYEDHADELDPELLAEVGLYLNSLDNSVVDGFSDEELEYYVSDIIDEFTAYDIINTVDL